MNPTPSTSSCPKPLPVKPWIAAVSRPGSLALCAVSKALQDLGLQCPSSPETLAGRTRVHLENWRKITSDQWVLEVIQGYRLELTGSPEQTHIPSSETDRRSANLISDEVQSMLDKGAIHSVQQDAGKGWFSRIFLVPKREGKFRPVVNLRPLNRWIRYRHFKMEGIHIVKDLLKKGDYMTRVDLKDAYFAVPVHAYHQRYLRFQWKGQAYEFSCLPFGLASAPRVFTKIMKPVVGFLRSKGVRCVIYLDDLLVMHQDKEELKDQSALAVNLLEALGFLVNYPKSQLEPSQTTVYLGFVIDSVKKELQLPNEKVDKIRTDATRLLRQSLVSARELAQLIGRMSAAILAVYPAPLHYRSLQVLKHKALAVAGYDGRIKVSPDAKEDLLWWANNLRQWNGHTMSRISAQVVMETDASRSGWGAFCQGEATGGCWSTEEQKLHINALELLAVFHALKAFLKNREAVSVLVQSDNTSVVSHINRLGGTRSPILVDLTKKMFAWCLERQIRIQAQHLPGKINLRADFLSRHLRDRTDWILNAKIFTAINRIWGPLQVDLFATRFSAQLQRFFSWRADPEAEATDAFSQSWEAVLGFAHPPWCLITRVLMKVQVEEATVVLITPLWETQPWFPVITSMLVDLPVLLPNIPDLLTPSPNCDCPVLETQPQLVAWKVSGNTSEQKRSQAMLLTSSCLPGEVKQIRTIILPGESGKNGAGREVHIPFRLMSPPS